MIWLWLPGSLWMVTLVAGFVLHRPAKRQRPPQADYVKISRLEQQLGIGPPPPGTEFGLDELGFPMFKRLPPPPPPKFNEEPLPMPPAGQPVFVNQVYTTPAWCRRCGHMLVDGHAPWCPNRLPTPPLVMRAPDQRCALCFPGGPPPGHGCPFYPVCQA